MDHFAMYSYQGVLEVLYGNLAVSAVRKVLRGGLGYSSGPITPASRLRDDLGIDSLAIVATVLDIEDKFQIKLPDGVEAEWQTVADIVKTVRGRFPGAQTI